MAFADVSQAELARLTALPHPTINKIVHGQTKDPRLSTILVIANALKVSLNQLAGIDPLPSATEDFQKSQRHFIPVIEWHEILDYINDTDYPCQFKKWLAVDTEQNKNRYFALKTTPSMAPRFKAQSLIIVEPTELPQIDGRIVLISFNNGEPTLRRVMKDGENRRYRKLHPEVGEKTLTLEAADRILGVIVETRMPES